jgi:hypothetical protein
MTGDRVFIVYSNGERLEGTILRDVHVEYVTTSRSWSERCEVVTIQWDDGDLTDERADDFTRMAP